MKAKYPEDQEKLDKISADLDKVMNNLIEDPFSRELNRRLRELEIKIAALTGESIIDIYFEPFK